jgi:hypothetical protein
MAPLIFYGLKSACGGGLGGLYTGPNCSRGVLFSTHGKTHFLATFALRLHWFDARRSGTLKHS